MLHLDRLPAADAALLTHEDLHHTHMHIGWVLIGEGPPPPYADVLAHVRSRLSEVPRYRQKLLYPPLRIGRPFWIDDPRFNLEYHVRHTALPAPGSIEQLRNLAGRIFSQRLDRSKPLWELWLVQGLEGDRFAVINKTHRALVDGVHRLDITTLLFDRTPTPTAPRPSSAAWIPHPEPTPPQLAAAALRDALGAPRQLGEQLGRILDSPETARAAVQELVDDLKELAAGYIDPPSPTPFNVALGTHRRMAWLRYPLADFKDIKDALGATVNDIYIAAVSGALNRWFRHRGLRTRGVRLRAAVPVSQQWGTGDAAHSRVVEVFAPLPIDCNDPVQRVRIVHRALHDLKSSRRALGARAIASLQEFAPPALMAQVARLGFSTRFFNLVVANVPGPETPLYLLGRQVVQIAPVGFLLDNSALMFLLVSYNGMLEIGITADPDALPDLDLIAEALDDAVVELKEAAGRERRPARQRRKRSASARGEAS
jgi:WS/DGAT/MGAT family acyltransferase